jgi:ankyrin repeat protein
MTNESELRDQFDVTAPFPSRDFTQHASAAAQQPGPKSASTMSETTISTISDSNSEDEHDFMGKRLSSVGGTTATTSNSVASLPQLHKDLTAGSWSLFHQHLQTISINTKELTAVDPRDNLSTPLHTASWKAPPPLSLILINLLRTSCGTTRQDEFVSYICAKDSDGNTPLHLCCANLDVVGNAKHVDTSVLEALVEAAPKALEIPNNEKDSPLHLLVSSPAAAVGAAPRVEASMVKCIQLLLHKQTSKQDQQQDGSGGTPLHAAIGANASAKVLETLLQEAPHLLSVEDDRGMLPLHYVAAICQTPASIVQKMVQLEPSSLWHQTANGDTPLHLAVSNSSTSLVLVGNDPNDIHAAKLDRNATQIITILMSGETAEPPAETTTTTDGSESNGSRKKKSPMTMMNREKLTPLHGCALFDAPPALTRLLMTHPRAKKAAKLTNSFGATPLHLAAAQPGVAQSIATVQAIGTAESACVQDRLKRTPLHVAAQNTHATAGLISSLAQLNNDATAVKTQRGHLPLHLAAQSQAKEPVIQALIKAYPQATEARNKSSNTPLHDAAKYRAAVGVVQLLLETYPDAVYVQNQYGNLPLHCATAYQAPADVVLLLLKAWPDGASMQNRNQDAPLHYAAAYATSPESVSPLLQAAPAAVLLLNSSGQSPIDRAKANNAPAPVIELLETSADEWTKKAASDGWGNFSPDFEHQPF